MKGITIRKLAVGAMMMALVTAATMFISIKVPGINNGYIHPGDAMIYAAAWLMGGPWGAAIGGLGSALADLLAGYAAYVPGTLLIKAAMGFLVGWACTRFPERTLPRIGVTVAAGAMMVVGYFLYELVLYGYGAALAGVGFNMIQAVGGVILAEPVIRMLHRIPRAASLR